MKRFLLLVSLFLNLGLTVFGGQGDQPACTRDNRGEFWPREANTDRPTRERAARCGQLKICTSDSWKMGWEAVSIPYWRLAGTATPEECQDLRADSVSKARRARF